MFNDEHVAVIQNPEEEVGAEDETRNIFKRTPYLVFYVQRCTWFGLKLYQVN
jgi:hypothetical protein